MAWRCYISNFRSLGCQEAHQEGPYPPSPGWILEGLGCFLYTIELVLRNYQKLTPQMTISIHCVINSNVLSCIETHD